MSVLRVRPQTSPEVGSTEGTSSAVLLVDSDIGGSCSDGCDVVLVVWFESPLGPLEQECVRAEWPALFDGELLWSDDRVLAWAGESGAPNAEDVVRSLRTDARAWLTGIDQRHPIVLTAVDRRTVGGCVDVAVSAALSSRLLRFFREEARVPSDPASRLPGSRERRLVGLVLCLAEVQHFGRGLAVPENAQLLELVRLVRGYSESADFTFEFFLRCVERAGVHPR